MSASKKIMIIIRGLSGSGKKTIANLICDEESMEYLDDPEGTPERVSISADDYFYDEDGSYKFNPEEFKAAHEWCKNEVEVCAKQGYEVIVVHNPFTRKWEVDPYFQIAISNGYRISVLNLYDSGLNDAQLASRSEQDIPVHNIRKQRQRWELDVFRENESQKLKNKKSNYKKQNKNFRSRF